LLPVPASPVGLWLESALDSRHHFAL